MTQPTATPAMIDAQALVKTYELGGQVVRALDGVSFSVNAGEMVAIRGPSGSGKSTLMNIIGCLDRPDGGSYALAGEPVWTSRADGRVKGSIGSDRLADIRNRRIGFVFQSFNLLPRMSALENVELPLMYSATKGAKEKARHSLEIVGLKERSHHEPNQLSGGQRQRVAIARAMVTDPAIILADEPTGALDSRTGEEILDLFKKLNAMGRTIIVVTHDLKVAHHCQREIFLRDGRIGVDEDVQPSGSHAAFAPAGGAAASVGGAG
jgi:putative ABC transport system ATP-binding protein